MASESGERVPRGRVLCVTSNYPRWEGDTTTPFVAKLAKDLKTLGWTVDVLAPHFPGASSSESLDGIHVARFRYAVPDAAQTVCYQGGALVNLRQRPSEKLKLPALVIAEWAAVQAALQTGDYDLLHSHWVLPQGFVGMLASSVCSVPHVVTLHGGDVFSLTSPLMTRLKSWALRSADGVTVNSSFTERAVRDIAEPKLLRRIPMGVEAAKLSDDERRQASKVRSTVPGEGPLLVFVGRLVREKGAADLLRAVELLGDALPARVLVVGEGPERAELERHAREAGLARRVRFVGWVQSGEIRAHLAAADVFVGPSKRAEDGWVEAQGLTFLEAMAVGTPVVATRSGGIVDSVVHEETGLLVEEGKPEEIAAAIRRLVQDEGLRRCCVEGALRRVRERFTRVGSAASFDELFRQLATRN